MKPIKQFQDHPSERHFGPQTLYALEDDFFLATDSALVRVHIRHATLHRLVEPEIDIVLLKLQTDMGRRNRMAISIGDCARMLAQIATIAQYRSTAIDPLLASDLNYQAAVAAFELVESD
jgi:hypothetical protein